MKHKILFIATSLSLASVTAMAVSPSTNNTPLPETVTAGSTVSVGALSFTANPTGVAPVNSNVLTQIKPVVRGSSSNTAYVTGSSRSDYPKVPLNTAQGYTGDVGVTAVTTQPALTATKQGSTNKCNSPLSMTVNVVATSSSYLPRMSAGITMSFSTISGAPTPGVWLGAVGSSTNSSFLVSCTISASTSSPPPPGASYCTTTTPATNLQFTRAIYLEPSQSASTVIRFCPGPTAGSFKANVIVTPAPSSYGAWFTDTNPANQSVSSNTITVN